LSLRYVVILRNGPNWVPGLALRSQKGHVEHLAHWGKWLKKGFLAHGGHFMDHSGGMMICAEGIAEEDIQQFLAQDPAIRSGLFIGYVKPWFETVTSLVMAP
jgi:uncharacterized protein YciI